MHPQKGESVQIEQMIIVIRDHKVILDCNLARLYEVETKRIVEALKRNSKRFPKDFVFQLTNVEFHDLKVRGLYRLQHGGRRVLPYAFTEQGVAMASSVLNSERAISVNIDIMRAFVRMRQAIAQNDELNKRLDQIEEQLGNHSKHIRQIFGAIRMMIGEQTSKRPIGFGVNNP